MEAHVNEALQQFHRIAVDVDLWPGFRPETTPLVLYNREVAFLVGHPAPPAGYQPLAPICGRTVHMGPTRPEMAANTASVVGGVLCALAMLPEAGEPPEVFARLMLHESFHVFQQQGLRSVPGPDSRFMALYPENDPENNALAAVENRLLISALDGDAAAPARFLAVRLHRQGRQGEGLRVYEVRQEYNEGTPTYIEMKAGRSLSDLKERLAQCNIGGKWAGNARFYMTGAAIALLLDRLMPGWQAERFARGNATLQSLLAEAVGGTLPDAGSVLESAGYAELLVAEREREWVRQQKMADLLAQLEPGEEGYRVEIEIGQAPGCMWNPSAVMVMRPGLRIHPGFFGAVGPSIRITMEHLCLEDRQRQVAVLRLPELPVVTSESPFRFEAPGLKGEAPAGRIEVDGRICRIKLG